MARNNRTHSCSYLYHDGTLVQVFDERRNGQSVGETVDVIHGYCPPVTIRPGWNESPIKGKGRIVLHKEVAVVKIMKGCAVTAIAPSIEGGSENSKEMNVPVGYFIVHTKHGELSWSIVEKVVGSEFTVQPEITDRTEGMTVGERWGSGARIVSVTDLRQKAAA